MVWLAENLLNVARYMADARRQELPLVGGGDHDWAEIFSRWHVLGADTFIAGATRLAAVGLMAGTLVWLYRRWMKGRYPVNEGDATLYWVASPSSHGAGDGR